MRKFKAILGVGLSVVLVAGLVLGVVPVSAGTLTYSTTVTPSGVGSVLVASAEISVMAAAPDGTTLFAYDNTAQLLYKSTNAGVTWTSTSIGGTLEGNTVNDMAVSPDYATDLLLVAATDNIVYRSQNGGVTFGAVSTSDLQTTAGFEETVTDSDNATIKSIDITGQYYTGGAPAILVGTADPTADEFGGVYLCRLDTWDWTDLSAGSYDFYAVAFSPLHISDAQVLAVGASATATTLRSKFAAKSWADDIGDASIRLIPEENLTRAVMAFADDYEWSSNNRVLVGTTSSNTSAASDDLFRVHGGTTSAAYDLNVNGSTAEANIHSIAVSGGIVGADVIIGQSASMTIKRTADPTASTVVWAGSVKAPTGASSATVIMAADFATSSKVMVGTAGEDSAFSASTDGGVLFNGLSLIEVSSLPVIDYHDLAIVDANTMFLLVMDNTNNGTLPSIDADDTQMLFRTTDAGVTWQRVYHNRATATDGVIIVKASPDYATDSTVYIAQSDTRLWKSTNGGDSWVGLAAPIAITALAVVDKDNYFTGHSLRVYKSGKWNYGTITGSAKSIVLSPDFANDDTVVVGNDDGDVYLSTNASAAASVVFTRQGADDSLGNGATVTIALHPNYATAGATGVSTIFAGSSTATYGVYRTTAASAVWTQCDDDTDSLIANGVAVSPDGTLYAASGTANGGIRREVSPTLPAAYLSFEDMGTVATSGVLTSLAYLPGTASNVLYALVSGISSTTYTNGWSIVNIADTFSVTPVITGPADGAIDQGTLPVFSWESIAAPSGTVVTYTYDVATDAAFANKTISADTTTGTSITASTALTPGVKYWWRVYVAAAGPLATRKASRTFVVALAIASQSSALSAPAPGAQDTALAPSFQWAPVGGATDYRIQLASASDFADTLSDKLLTTTVWQYDGTLANDTTYYWRVKAISGSTEGAWSVGVFTTEAAAVAAAAPVPQVTITKAAAIPVPTITATVTVPAPPPATTITIPPALPAAAPVITEITPGWIYAIIVVGAVLVIAVVVLIIRTRRVV